MKIVFNGLIYENVEKNIFPNRGSVPIPDGYSRMYHQTSFNNVDSIKQNGLQVKFSKGKEVGDPIGIWASEDQKGFYGSGDENLVTVEFKIPTTELDNLYGRTLITRDIPPEDIITIHEPWQSTVNTLVKTNKVDDVKSGKFDSFINDNPRDKYNVAVRWIKENL